MKVGGEFAERFVGCYFDASKKRIVDRSTGKEEIYDLSQFRLMGDHNRENLMAAIVRETAEEAGVLIGLTGILGFDQDWAPDGSATRLRFVFVGYQGIAGPPKTTPDRHSRGAAWLTKAELAARRLRDPEVLTWIERHESHATLLPCASYRPRGGGAS
jgi:8-oxo-dGTP pyrophosphatase MutT (NUDIX family)